MKNLAGLLLLSTIAFTSCHKARLRGEGAVVSETRTVSSFYTVELDGESNAEIIPSNTNKVVVTGYQNLVPVFETNVSGEKLTLKFRDKYINVRNNNIKVLVYTTQVSVARINGSGNIQIGDSLKTTNMQADINGSGNLYFGKNKFDKLEMRISGSGNISAYNAVSKYVDAHISGSGDIQTTVTETLNAHISGSGDINYSGNPYTVNLDVSGSGKVRKN